MKKRILRISLFFLLAMVVIYIFASLLLSLKINNMLNSIDENGSVSSVYCNFVSDEALNLITRDVLIDKSDKTVKEELTYYRHSIPMVVLYGFNATATYKYSCGITSTYESGEKSLSRSDDVELMLNLKLDGLNWKIVDANYRVKC